MCDRQRRLAAAATTTNKPVNQDAFAVARNDKAGLTAVLVADGVGSSFGAQVASGLVVEKLREDLEHIASPGEIDIPHLFSEARAHLERHVNRNAVDIPADLDWAGAFATTLLCAVETPEHFLFGYVGNGAIFHLRGDFNCFPPTQLLPWTAVNYLNPHSVSRNGRNVLYKALSVRAAPHEINPTVLTLTKDGDLFGDIVVVCSDGIYSLDQVPIGKDDQGRIWISGEESLVLLLESLARFLADSEYTDTALQSALEGYLQQLRTKALVTDDCTVGVIVTPAALRYQQSLRLKQRG